MDPTKCQTFTNRNGVRVSVISGRHPDVPERYVHYIEVAGVPERMSQGGLVTYPDRPAATFAAKSRRPK